jgi:hypothetical protein
MAQPATFLVEIKDEQLARDLTEQWLLEWQPHRYEKPARYFPDKLSPNGQAPITHLLCFWPNMTDEVWASATARIASHRIPIVAERLTVDCVTKADKHKANAEWIASKNLKAVK